MNHAISPNFVRCIVRCIERLLARLIAGFAHALALPALCLLLMLGTVTATAQAATAPAGSVIGNQAAATYSDGSAVVRTVTSNLVTTTVQQVASVLLAATSAKTISTGGQVYYPHTITNTGNGVDTFALTSSATGTFTFGSVTLYADANGDGVPDNAVPITSTGQLAPGQVFKFVAAGVVPTTAVSGNTNALTLTATSGFTNTTTAVVIDTTTVTSQAVIGVTQALDVTSGASPAGPRTITLTYTNTGNTTATNVTLAEAIPSGMTYVAASGRWSVTGTTVLTDADATDSQSGIIYDYGITAAGKMTAVIASVAPGASGTLSYKVNINSGLPAGATSATASTATFAYNDGAANIAASNTNTVQYTVISAASVTITGATVASATQGAVVNFPNTVTNTGNATDSFDITTATSTFPAGTTFQLYQADGVTPLSDSNGNSIPDTGPLAPGASVVIVIKATLPTTATGGPYTFNSVATSKVDPTKTATAVNTLTTITANLVDLTNNTSGAGAPGYGPGPEGAAVTTVAIAPGATGVFTLVTANNSAAADTFSIQASTDSTFATTVLPTGWSVSVKDGNGAVVDGTGVLTSGSTKTLYANITVPAGQAPGSTQVYFRAISVATGAADRLHDAVTVGTVRSLTLTPNQGGQVTAGGTVVYTHTVTNTGNVLEADSVVSTGTLSTADSQAGFTTVIYWDKNNNGVLDAGDPVITNLSQLTGGTNGASTTAGLAPGASARLFVKVTAPSQAAVGIADATTFTLTVSGTINGIAAPTPVVATDSTSIIASQITLITMQAINVSCNGSADTAYAISAITTGAQPGTCIRYQVTATNVGPVAITNLVVSDATPAYTTYSGTVAASATAGTVTAPSSGSTGTVQTSVASLAPGAAVVLTFGVRINP